MSADLTREAISAIDPQGMLGLVEEQPAHLTDALWRVESAGIEAQDAPGGLAVCAMGGSAIGADIAAGAIGRRGKRPMITLRGYELPPWVGADTAVLCSSYSGNTEETLATYAAAREVGARRIVVTTGGKLAELARDGLVRGEEGEDRLERLVHHLALAERVDPHHERVRGQRARADAEHRPPERQVVEQDHAVGQDERVMVRERAHARPQPDVARALGRGRDEHLRRRNDLVARRVVLPDPRLVVGEVVEELDQLEVPPERVGGIVADAVERRHEDAEVHAVSGAHVGVVSARSGRGKR